MADAEDTTATTTLPVRLEWVLESAADIHATWAVLSDTDRFNRAMGLNFEFDETPREGGGVDIAGRSKRYGLTMRWDERRFDFEEPRRFVIERIFKSGPVLRTTVSVKLTEKEGGGTTVQYKLAAWPKNLLVRPIVSLDFTRTIKPQLGEVLRKAIKLAAGQPVDYDPGPDPLPADVQARVDRVCGALTPAAFGEALRRFLVEAPLHQQDSMAPLALARRWELPDNVVIDGCLAAVREGILSLKWDLICPSCDGAKERVSTFDTSRPAVHCDTCNIRYDAVSPESIGVSFRPSPSVRQFEVVARCIASPGRTPRVMARIDAGPDETIEWLLPLEPGGYRLRDWSSLSGANLDVHDGVQVDTVTAELRDDGIRPAVLTARPGPVRIAVRNRTQRTVRIVVERRWRPPDVLTAGRLLGRPGARHLLPKEALGPGLDIVVLRSAVLVTEVFRGQEQVFDDLRAALSDPAPRRLYTSDRRVVATWSHFEEALSAAERLDGAYQVHSSVGLGPVTELTTAQRSVPSGQAVDEAMAALRVALPGRSSVPGSVAEEDDVVAAVSKGARLVPGPRVGGRQDYLVKFEAPPGPPPSLASPLDVVAPDDKMEGRRIDGRYLLTAELGGGGFGKVYAARDTVRNSKVVVKLLLPSLVRQPLQTQWFFNEARACAQLSSPRTVRVFDFGHADDGRLYLVMEELVGKELQDAIASRATLSPAVAAHIAIGVLQSLEEAHAAGLVHRDIKPSNIFLCESGSDLPIVKVIDFGIALHLSDEDADEQKRLIAGTPKYMSPEHLGHGTLDARSDLYSLGLMLYRVLTGWVPMEKVGGIPMILRRMTDPIPDVQGGCDDPLPAGMSDAIMRALAPHQEDRWKDARSMRLALEAAVEAGVVDVNATTSSGASLTAAEHSAEEEHPTLVSDEPWRGGAGEGDED